jgi:hypothetical protein
MQKDVRKMSALLVLVTATSLAIPYSNMAASDARIDASYSYPTYKACVEDAEAWNGTHDTNKHEVDSGIMEWRYATCEFAKD